MCEISCVCNFYICILVIHGKATIMLLCPQRADIIKPKPKSVHREALMVLATLQHKSLYVVFPTPAHYCLNLLLCGNH